MVARACKKQVALIEVCEFGRKVANIVRTHEDKMPVKGFE
jgi:hypothetical protein